MVTSRVTILALVGWITILAIGGTGLLFQMRLSGNLKQPSNEGKPAPQESFRTNLRSQSCATSNCHGSFAPESTADQEIRGDEYFVWQNDPHSRAYLTLLGKRSQEIFERLGVEKQDLFSPAKEFQKLWNNCLGCHETSVQLRDSLETTDASGLIGEGVSCESCHGNSRDWLHRHYRKDWNQITASGKRQLHFFHEGDTAGRIQQCTHCHVGSGNGDVDHDLLAAGHPALKFEYVWYKSRLPQHWKPNRSDRNDRGEHPLPIRATSGQTREWLIGQLVMSVAALEQLERRASRKVVDQNWPEFSEYDCFACHHDLKEPSWRADRVFAEQAQKRSKVVVPWGNWNLEFIQMLADEFGRREIPGSILARDFSTSFDQLREACQRSRIANKDASTETADDIRKLSREVKAKLGDWLNEVSRSREAEAQQLLRQIARNHPQRLISSWDRTSTVLLGFAARHRGSNSIPAALKSGMNQIRFPDDPTIVDSPRDFRSDDKTVRNQEQPLTAEQWIALLKELADLIPDQ